MTLRSSINVEDLIHMQENFSGTKLTCELRKRLPQVIPSKASETLKKPNITKNFSVFSFLEGHPHVGR